MITYFQAIVLGLIQGITELFPISSLGHSVILPKLIGWNIDQTNNNFLIFLVATHLATALVLLFFYINDWIKIFKGMILSLKDKQIRESNHYGRLGWLLVVGTIPAGILGLIFEEKIKLLFATPNFVAVFLIMNAIMLFLAEKLAKKTKSVSNENVDKALAKSTWITPVKIGLLQCLALLPGFSRTGATITGGLINDFTHDEALRFSFLLATPIIGAAAVLKLPELILTPGDKPFGPILVGFICSGIAAYLSVKFLTKYFHTKKLNPFAFYCLIIGILSTLIFWIR